MFTSPSICRSQCRTTLSTFAHLCRNRRALGNSAWSTPSSYERMTSLSGKSMPRREESFADLTRRSGQNLSDRHTRLSKSIRSKLAYAQSLDSSSSSDQLEDEVVDPTKPQTILSSSSSSSVSNLKSDSIPTSKGVETGTLFHGIIIPDKPRPPQSDGPYPFSSSRLSSCPY